MPEQDIEIRKYHPEDKKVWNEFVESSKNGTFLFNRDYMDYHSDRFQDNSYLIYRKNKLYCLLPGCRKEEVFSSHAGLTYGGLIMNRDCTAEGILEVFSDLKERLVKEGFTKWIYKAIPHIYHKLPSEEDLYALFINDAKLIVRNVSSTILLNNRIPVTRQRRRSLTKALDNDIEVKPSSDFDSAWQIINDNLMERYGVKPVHDVVEISLLSRLFPNNIKLYGAYIENEMIGVALMYYTEKTAHAQYIHANRKGKEIGAVDALIEFLLENCSSSYFDFGNSNEKDGRYLNESLIHLKQGFGGRAVCYDIYEIAL
ncbi:MAG: GNAT family N-acetyltransferase [Muribaculaceae bacterium]|nr:GNAT family N-acetyltransferase [Muribaculaceae bacterium]